MLLFEVPAFLKSSMAKELIVSNQNDKLSFNLPTAKYFKNTITSGMISALFTTPDMEKSLVKTISLLETEYLITKLNEIIKAINFPENISIFHYDQIFNNNMFKFYVAPSKITHVIYSNDKFNLQAINSTYSIEADFIELNQKIYNTIITKELNDSLIFIKIRKDSNVNIHKLIAILAQNSYILNFDQHSRIITFKLKYPIDLIHTFKDVSIDPLMKIITVDRTDELFQFLK